MVIFRFKKIFIILTISLLILSCEKDYYVEELSLLQNQAFNTDVRVQGHEFNGLIMDNCIFDGGELYISEVDSIIVRNCTFKNQKKNGIRIGFGGQASHIIIENCTFNNIGSNGIDSHEDAPNCTIKNCHFENCALSDIGAAMGQPHHAIYWKGKNVSILNNTFITGDQRKGNTISHRSSGIISGNRIIGAKKYAIMYYADHPGGDSLIIENNFISHSANGIGITSPGNLDFHNKNVIIRFNTVYKSEKYSVFVKKTFESTTNIELYCNILSSPIENYISTEYDLLDTLNFKTVSNVGFIGADEGDLHLNSSSEAIGYCSGWTIYPLTDIDNETRSSTQLDAGADERN